METLTDDSIPLLSKFIDWLIGWLGVWRGTRRKAAIALCEATQELQWAAWEWVSLHTQYGVARDARDFANEEDKILQKFGTSFRVFSQDYDLPTDLAEAARREMQPLNLALANMKAFSMTGQESDMTEAAQEIQQGCERIREAARPHVYGAMRRLREEHTTKKEQSQRGKNG